MNSEYGNKNYTTTMAYAENIVDYTSDHSFHSGRDGGGCEPDEGA